LDLMRGSVTFDSDTVFARKPMLKNMLSATTYAIRPQLHDVLGEQLEIRFHRRVAPHACIHPNRSRVDGVDAHSFQ